MFIVITKEDFILPTHP